MKTHIGLVATAVVVLISCPTPAAAYVDPVTGSMAIQMLIGGLLTVAAASKRYWRRIRQVIGGKSSETADKDIAGPSAS